MQLKTVVPGDKLSTEEELTPHYGTFLEDGYVYSYLVGNEDVKDGGAYVAAKGNDVKTFSRRMMALGTVTDDLRTVMFVKLGKLEKGNTTYVGLKSGKILAKQDSRPTGHGARKPIRSVKPCGIGDIVLALIIGEDKDVYALGINSPECGVVYAECEMCSNILHYNSASRALECEVCKHVEYKKVSTVYNNPKEIENILNEYPKKDFE